MGRAAGEAGDRQGRSDAANTRFPEALPRSTSASAVSTTCRESPQQRGRLGPGEGQRRIVDHVEHVQTGRDQGATYQREELGGREMPGGTVRPSNASPTTTSADPADRRDSRARASPTLTRSRAEVRSPSWSPGQLDQRVVVLVDDLPRAGRVAAR